MSALYLVNLTPTGELKSKFRLPARRLLVGRSMNADLYLGDPSVSRRHAELLVNETHVSVRDLASRNGTFVDDKSVAHSVVHPQQKLRFGAVEFLLTAEEHLGMASSSAPDTTDMHMPPVHSGSQAVLEVLTPAQRRVFDLLIEGMLEKQIAWKLDISPHTVHNHIRAIYRAFGVHSRAELLVRVLRRQT
uniref:FHA domain-containing protein n=1 Tax=Schlesneria paludicola TaxID=360056 RepID=A0A7C4QVH8_9PLAN